MKQFFDIHDVSEIKGIELDFYLSLGWYRYGAFIFTTNFFNYEAFFLPAIWMRYQVPTVKITRSNKKILQASNRFEVNIQKFESSDELETLHNIYYNTLSFSTSETLQDLLQDVSCRVYDTHLITVRDNRHLIAAGIFDVGMNSIAGIKNIYHPDYKKYSPGKLLMLLKYNYCIENKIEWYYPGYIVPGCQWFDYKLFLDKNATQLLDYDSKHWLSYDQMRALEGNPFNLL